MPAYSWKNGINGDWSVRGDWSDGTIPGKNDDVAIGVPGAYSIEVSVAEAALSLDFTASGATLAVDAALDLGGSLTVTAGLISIATGQTLAASGAVSFGVNGSYGPMIEGPGTLLTSGPVSLAAQTGYNYKDLYLGDGATWNSSGTVTDAGLIDFGVKENDTAAFVNQAGGVFDLTTDNANLLADAGSDTASFSNAGLLQKTGGTATSTIAAGVTNTATGTIAVTAGTLALGGGGSLAGHVTTAAASTLAFAGGSFAVTGAIAAADLLIDGGAVDFAAAAALSGGLTQTSGTLQAAANLSESGSLTVTAGLISIANGQTLAASGATSFGVNGSYGPMIEGPGTLLTNGPVNLAAQTGYNYKDLYLGDGATWNSSGTVTDAGLIDFGVKENDTAAFVNQAGGVFDLTTDNANLLADIGSDTASFSNAGLLQKTGGTATSTIAAAVTNTATGTIAVTAGTLTLASSTNQGLINQGTLHALTGGDLDVVGSLNGSVLTDSGGTVEVGQASSAAVTFTGNGVLELDLPASFAGSISGLVAGSKIIFGGAAATGISVKGSTLNVDLANGTSFDLNVTGLQGKSVFALSSNTLTATIVLQQPTSDLIVTGVSAAADVLAGEPFPITWTDINQGSLAADGPWTDEVFLASDATGDNAQLLGTLDYTGTLDPGQSTIQTLAITLPGTTSGSAYFLIKADALNQVTNDGTGPDREGVTQAVTIVPTAVPTPPITLRSVNLSQGSNLGDVTVTIDGAQLSPDDAIALVSPGGTIVDATNVDWVSASTLWATFNLTGMPTGSYSAQVSDASSTATLPSAFHVNSAPAGQLSVNLILPEYTNQGQTGTGLVTYANTGDTDIEAPILDVGSSQATLSLSGSVARAGSIDFLGTNPSGPAGILTPGASGSFSFTYTPTAQGDLTIAVGTAEQGATIDWSSLESRLQPPTVDATDWNNVYTAFVDQVGTTTASLNTALSQDVTELSQVGQPTDDIATLLQYQLFQASGALAGTYLTDATEFAPTSSPFSLSLQRFYDGTLLGRDATGAFGDGWTSNYDVTATTDTSGNVYVQSPGVLHIFTRQAGGDYAAQAGDPATLTLSGSLYRMNDGSGDIEQFNAAGQLASIMGANGNLISLAYGSNGVLRTVTSETIGETITFTSDTAGRITSATDSDGQTVTYSYNAAGTQLLSAGGADSTTSYTYVAPSGSLQDNALALITGPDGTKQSFTYDSEGRLATQSSAAGAGQQTYRYGAGEVTVTDSLGKPTTLLYGANGAVAQVQDALGNVTQLASNTAGELTGVTTAGGSVYRYGYDALGNLTSYIDPLGGTISAGYAPGTQNLTDFTDQRGNAIDYTYDTAGNVTGITYTDGSGDSYDYNLQGLLTSRTDADGSTTAYAYDAAGELTSETFANGTANTYAYDSQGNLIAATAPGDGTTNYTYNAANQLTSVTNPQGQVESYTYNATGELATRTEPGGSVEQFSYDAVGRLTQLQDGAGNLLDKYTYNAAGELARTDTGNGASTAYAYDADGDVTQITNDNADGSLGSFYDYTYNANGQVVEEVTAYGAWAYGYDASGELTNAVFLSINTAVPSQNISYVYDAAGNRVSQTIDGVVTGYTTNELNQYTTVGGTTNSYDAGGHLTNETDNTGTTTFTYNQNGQLLSEIGAGVTDDYTYDALGNRVSATQNGTTVEYINDPLSLSVAGQLPTSIAQTYNVTGTLDQTY